MINLTHLSLCSGIGGLDLAAEWAGFETVAQCEIDEYASRTLQKNFKGVYNFGDIRTITAKSARSRGIYPGAVTVISAGFPCQPYSLAGKGKGDSDSRDLWAECERVIRELRPKHFVGENVPGLLTRGNGRYFRRIKAALKQMGYRVWWGMWGAYDVGAPHQRDRVFIVGHADRDNACEEREIQRGPHAESRRACANALDYGEVSYPVIERRDTHEVQRKVFEERLSEEDKRRIQARRGKSCGICGGQSDKAIPLARCKRQAERRVGELCEARQYERAGRGNGGGVPEHDGREWWKAEPDVGRVAHGVPSRVDRLDG